MSDDDLGRELREQLDRELASVRSDPAALREVLARGRREPQRRAAAPAWLLAAAAAGVVAVAAPVLATTVLDRGDDGGPERLAGPAVPAASSAAVPTLPASTLPASTLPASALPAPAPSATAPRRAAPAPAPAPAPRTSAPSSPAPRSTRSAVAVPPPPAVPPSSRAGCAGASVAPAAPGPTPAVEVDLDGDGALDPLTLSGSVLVARLSSGGAVSTSLRAVSGTLAVLPVETDGTRGPELLLLTRGAAADDGTVGRRGTLYDLRSCTLGPVLNAKGAPYVFRVGGDATGSSLSGLACDRGVLVGLTSALQPDGTWLVTRTPVTSSGAGRAVNGAPTRSTVLAGTPEAQALAEASCGTQDPLSLN